MLHDNLQVYTLGIVFVGDFNPVIIQPFWLAAKQLIREGEAKNAKIELIHNDVCKFDLDWVHVEVTKKRFELRTAKEPYFEATRDLALSIFGILKETPMTALGINHIKNFALRDAKTYEDFGDRLSPLSNWRDVFLDPKLLQLDIIDVQRKDKLNGNFRVRITATDRVLDIKYGVAFNINDHFSLPAESEGRNGEMVKILAGEWQRSIERAQDVVESVWSKVNL
jgi:hypothetical protein